MRRYQLRSEVRQFAFKLPELRTAVPSFPMCRGSSDSFRGGHFQKQLQAGRIRVTGFFDLAAAHPSGPLARHFGKISHTKTRMTRRVSRIACDPIIISIRSLAEMSSFVAAQSRSVEAFAEGFISRFIAIGEVAGRSHVLSRALHILQQRLPTARPALSKRLKRSHRDP